MTKEKKERKLITVKIVNVFAGLLILGAAIWILLDTYAVDFFILMIALALNVIGFVRIFNGLYRDDLKKSVKVLKTITGILSLLAGTAIIVIDYRFSSLISITWLFLLVSIILLLNAISRFFTGIQASKYPLWYRILTIIGGFASLVIAVLIGLTNLNVVVIIPSQETQVILLAYTLILLALVRISLVFLKKPETI